MGWAPDNVVEALRQSHSLGLFLRVDTTPALHVWFGIEDKPAGFDSLDDDGTVYLGGGRLIGIPDLEVLLNGKAGSLDFTLSGVDPVTGSQMIDSLPPLRGAAVQMGLTTLDDYFQPMSKIIPVWNGMASHVSEQMPAVQGGQSPTLTLALSMVTGEATRSRAARTLWSSAQQKAISPTDLFCDATSRLARGVNPVWPNY